MQDRIRKKLDQIKSIETNGNKGLVGIFEEIYRDIFDLSDRLDALESHLRTVEARGNRFIHESSTHGAQTFRSRNGGVEL